MARLLIASLVDPATHPGGAGTYTRGLVAALLNGSGEHSVTLIGPLHTPPGPWHRTRQVLSLAGSHFSKLPGKVLFTRRHEFQIRIREALRSNHFDAVLINGSDMLWALDQIPDPLPCVLIAHNLEHTLLMQQQARYGFLTPVLRREAAKQRDYELQGFRRVRGVIFLSMTDMAWGTAHIAGLPALHVPPLFTNVPPTRKPLTHSPLRLGFLADFAWWPNRQNWKWLIDEILPKVHRPLQVHVFGRQSDKIPLRDGVVIHGLVREIWAVWEQVDIMVCPIRAGAGVSIKVAESLYNGMPVLATSQAVCCYACSSGRGLVVLDDADDWVKFLNSSEADRLATEIPSEELRRQFAIDRHIEQLNHFLVDVALGEQPLVEDGSIDQHPIIKPSIH